MTKNSQESNTPGACPYALNSFCARLSAEIKARMCPCCHVSRFPGGSVVFHDDWRETFSVLVEGFLVSSDVESGVADGFSPMEIAGGGSILTLPESWFGPSDCRTVSYIIKPCVVARFSREDLSALKNKSLPFAWAVADGLNRKYRETALAFQEIGSKDASRAVKYLLDFARRYDTGEMTHAQIALAAGLARPTVTRVMHELLAREPGGRE